MHSIFNLRDKEVLILYNISSIREDQWPQLLSKY